VTTGGGGMITTRDEAMARKCRYLTTQAKDDPLEYFHREIGYNYRLTNVLAALGVAQMERLVDYVRTKREIARRYREGLAGLEGIRLPLEAPWASSTFWLYTILVEPAPDRPDSRGLLRHLEGLGIQSRPLWHPNHLLPPHQASPTALNGTAERLNREALSIPCSVDLTEPQQRRVIAGICDLLA
jgi:perosamine synthetase